MSLSKTATNAKEMQQKGRIITSKKIIMAPSIGLFIN
jgi:hypothetical protein